MDGNFHLSHLGHQFPDTIPHPPHPTALTCVYVTPLKQIQLTIQSDFKSPCGHALVLNHVAQEEDHHAGVHLEGNKDPHRPHHVSHTCCSRMPLNSLCDCSRNVPIYRPLPLLLLHRPCTWPSPEKHQTQPTRSPLHSHLQGGWQCDTGTRSQTQPVTVTAISRSQSQGPSQKQQSKASHTCAGTTDPPAHLQALHLEFSLHVGD